MNTTYLVVVAGRRPGERGRSRLGPAVGVGRQCRERSLTCWQLASTRVRHVLPGLVVITMTFVTRRPVVGGVEVQPDSGRRDGDRLADPVTPELALRLHPGQAGHRRSRTHRHRAPTRSRPIVGHSYKPRDACQPFLELARPKDVEVVAQIRRRDGDRRRPSGIMARSFDHVTLAAWCFGPSSGCPPLWRVRSGRPG
jgi:hypothetical protein